MFGFDRIEIGIFLAAPAFPRGRRTNITHVAPVAYLQALAIPVNEKGRQIDPVDLEMAVAHPVPIDFEIGVPKARVVQDLHGRGVAFEFDRLVVRSFDDGRLSGVLPEMTAQ